MNLNSCSTLSKSDVSCTAGPFAGVIYPSVTSTSSTTSMVYPSPMILGVSTVQNESVEKLGNVQPLETIINRKRLVSQVTSIKAEPGSIMAMSDSSKKV